MRSPPSQPGQSRDPLIGYAISGRYRVLSLVARGSMGKVYRAEQVPLGRPVALKVLSPSVDETGIGGDIQDSEFYHRFFREAETLAKLKNPHTVTVFDYGSDEGIYYIAMEYLEGQTLSELIRAHGYLEPARAVEIAQQICQSLQESHAQDVIHRDLKPSNVVLLPSPEGEDFVKLLDWGLVKKLRSDRQEDLTQVGTVAGSPKYIAPEQIRGQQLDARADIYSLGVILYQMLVGKVPFDHPNPMDILMAHVKQAPPPMQVANPQVEVPVALQQIVMTCIAKNPGQRYRDITHLLEALKKAAVELKIEHVPTLTGQVASPAPAPRSSPAIRPGGAASPPARYNPPAAPAARPAGPVSPEAHPPWLSPEDEVTIRMRPAAKRGRALKVLATVIVAGFAAGAFYLRVSGGLPPAGDPAEPVAYQPETRSAGPATPAGQPANSFEQPALALEQPANSFQDPVTATEPRAAKAQPEKTEPGTTGPDTIKADTAGPDTAKPNTTGGPEETPRDKEKPAEKTSAGKRRARAASEPAVEITLRSAPPGASVFIDDLEVGTTPTTLTWQGPGAVQGRKLVVEFVKDGYFNMVIRRPIRGDSLAFDVALEPQASAGKPPQPSSPADEAPADEEEPEKVLPSPYREEPEPPPPEDEEPEPPPPEKEKPEPPPPEKEEPQPPPTPPAPPEENDDAPPGDGDGVE
jgi:serine/threonine protein kinase